MTRKTQPRYTDRKRSASAKATTLARKAQRQAKYGKAI